MPVNIPANITNSGNASKLFIPSSEQGGANVPVDVINGNLLVTGDITAAGGNIKSGAAGANDAKLELQAGASGAYLSYRPTVPDVLTVVNGAAAFSVSPAGNASLVPLNVSGAIVATGNISTTATMTAQKHAAVNGGNEGSLQENAVYFSNGSVGLQANSNNNSITVQKADGTAANMVVVGNLTVQGTLAANIPNATSYIMPLLASAGGSAATALNFSSANNFTGPNGYTTFWCNSGAIGGGVTAVSYNIYSNTITNASGLYLRQILPANQRAVTLVGVIYNAGGGNPFLQLQIDIEAGIGSFQFLVGIDNAIRQ
jgi:hypothetical protein